MLFIVWLGSPLVPVQGLSGAPSTQSPNIQNLKLFKPLILLNVFLNYETVSGTCQKNSPELYLGSFWINVQTNGRIAQHKSSEDSNIRFFKSTVTDGLDKSSLAARLLLPLKTYYIQRQFGFNLVCLCEQVIVVIVCCRRAMVCQDIEVSSIAVSCDNELVNLEIIVLL
jgi:hypothetical protein